MNRQYIVPMKKTKWFVLRNQSLTDFNMIFLGE